MGWPELYARGAAQRGVVTPACAAACGVRRASLLARARREHWPEPVEGGFVLPGWGVNGRARTVATTLVTGRDVAVTGWSALALHGLVRTAPTTVDLLVADNRRTVAGERIRTHWTQALPVEALVTIDGVEVTDVARSLAVVAGQATTERLRAIGLDGLVRGQLAIADLRRELDARGRFPGRGRYREVLRDLDGDGSESGFEFDARRRLIRSGLPPDRDQAVLHTGDGPRRIDIPFGAAAVGIDCVGFAYHSSPRDLERDVLRGNAIACLDRWLVLRLTFAMFHQQWEPFLVQLRDVLARRTAAA